MRQMPDWREFIKQTGAAASAFRLSLLGLLLLLCLLPSPSVTATGQAFAIAPPPAWVLPETPRLNEAATHNNNEAAHDLRFLLSDQQVRVLGKTTERYYHKVYEILSPTGIENGSQLELEFDPTYQKLVIHHLRIKRAGQTINALKPQEIRLIQQEQEWEQRLFNGTLSALAILNDVRVGDVIDYAYSINGENPILGGRFTETFYLAENEPVAQLRYRLLWPAARKLYFKTRHLELAPTQRTLGADTEYVWERTNAPEPEFAEDAPNGYDQYPQLQLSEFSDWQAVAQWAAPLYPQQTQFAPALAAQIEQCRQFVTPEQQLLAALRFVQDEVRYLGIEVGPHSHLPHQPAWVLERRYGDCKDKTYLLVTMLKALGIEAYPALVNTEVRRAVGEYLPSPYAFDHVIAQVQFNGQTYWLDPTVSLQRGPLSTRANANFGRALVVRADTRELAEMAPQPNAAPLITINQIFNVDERGEAVTLEVNAIYRGPDADDLRSELAQKSRAEFAKDRLKYYEGYHHGIAAVEPLQIRDDEATNTITIREQYKLPRFWIRDAHNFCADRIYQELDRPDEKATTQLIALTMPLDIEQMIEIRLPYAYGLPAEQGFIEHEAVRLDYSQAQDGKQIKLAYRFRTLRDDVAAANAAEYKAVLERIEDRIFLRLWRSGAPSNKGWVAAGIMLILLGPLALYGALKLRQAHQQRAQRQAAPQPVAPASAINLPD